MSNMKGCVVIGCRQNTLEFIERLYADGHVVLGIITLNQGAAEEAGVPEWADLAACFGNRAPVYVAESYKLSSAQDKIALSGMRADVGFCIGWQRILPDWLLSGFRNGIFGMHACQHPLPNGRGRSPINWSIIEGADYLHAHIFRYEAEPDNGLLLNVTKFPILPHDDINTLQQKCRVIFNVVVHEHWDALVNATPVLFAQDKTQPNRLYPKRTPDDGGINWDWKMRQVTDWVRAQTRPYPGAFTEYNNKRYHIWRCVPVGGIEGGNAAKDSVLPGIIIEKFADGTYFVQVRDGAVHLLDHDLPTDLTLGTQLPCLSCEKKTRIKTSV